MTNLIERVKAAREDATEGPWRAEQNDGPESPYGKAGIGIGSIPIFDRVFAETDDAAEAEDEHWVAGIWGKCGDEQNANARLIALAPDMARALLAAERAVERIQNYEEAERLAADTGSTADYDAVFEAWEDVTFAIAAYRKALEEQK